MRIRQRKLLAVAAALLLVPGLYVFLRGSPDPLYKGRPLGEWLVPFPSMTFHIVRKPPPATNAPVTVTMISSGAGGTVTIMANSLTIRTNTTGLPVTGFSVFQLPTPTYPTGGSVPLSASVNPLISYGASLKPGPSIEAIRDVGTDAIPTLLRFLRATRSDWKHKLVTLSRKQHYIQVDYSPADVMNGAAASGFATLGTAASNAVPALITILDGNYSFGSQIATIQSLAAVGPAAEKAVPALMRLVSNTNRLARFMALDALVVINPHRETVLPFLMTKLSDTDAQMRASACRAIARYGPNAGAAVPPLIRLLGDPSSDVQGSANVALYEIGATNSLPALMDAVKDSNPVVRGNAIHAISMFGAGAESSIPLLTNALNDSDPQNRERAAAAIRRIQGNWK